MSSRVDNRATFAEVFNSIKFRSSRQPAPARPWPAPGFAVNKSTYGTEALADDTKLIRSSN
jgi:hypothetical protein